MRTSVFITSSINRT